MLGADGVEAVEHAAAMLDVAGMPRMPARVMMMLVGAPDGGLTAAELGERLGVSPAAISGAVRYLQNAAFIRRLSRAGDRVARYDLMADGLHSMILANIPLYERLGAYIDTIAGSIEGAPASAARAREMADFLRFLGARMPGLVAEWESRSQPSTSVTPS
ncbi:helix-turn-helix domain-containing protein [Microbacterium sp. X-17]|uniref:GbsR/MarR family transcriptional regulator n=1 Tax=Microbacterium sp. X-17 TaxID=3144404 RepID=UPI0031F50536